MNSSEQNARRVRHLRRADSRVIYLLGFLGLQRLYPILEDHECDDIAILKNMTVEEFADVGIDAEAAQAIMNMVA